MKKIVLLSVLTSAFLMAGGYKIPEVSLNAVALSAANVAHSNGADAAYYNPANMAFMKDEDTLEVDLTYIGLDATNYKGTVASTGATQHDINAQSETFLAPSIHYVSGDIDGMRFGLSIVSPGGLSKRWDVQPAQSSAEEFTLQTIEINPSVAIAMDDKLALALGVRIIHSTGIVKASYPTVMSQNMTGDSLDYGYNLALSYKPTSELELGVTYRSNIDLTEEGSATLFYDADSVGPGLAAVDGKFDASVTVPLPALVNLALAYTLPSKTTVEFVYERTFWSAYETLDFTYNDPTAEFIFGTVKPKNWKDTNTYRIGVTQVLDEKTTLMAGAVYDETPVPDETLSFELPDSNTLAISFGGRYQLNEKMNIGLAALYSMKEKRSVTNASLDGKFSNSNALLISAGLEYKF